VIETSHTRRFFEAVEALGFIVISDGKPEHPTPKRTRVITITHPCAVSNEADVVYFSSRGYFTGASGRGWGWDADRSHRGHRYHPSRRASLEKFIEFTMAQIAAGKRVA
jgi:hypothetical protein